MGNITRCACYIILGVFILAHYPIASVELSDDDSKAARTDVIDKTVLALKSAFSRTISGCDKSCRTDRNAKLGNIEMDEAMSREAIELVGKLKSGQDIDLAVVNSWLERAGSIQRTYFNSVFGYHTNGEVKDALFYLDIGKPHQAAQELLSNQRTLTQIVADCSAFLNVAQGTRSGIPFKLLNQLTDLTPYHDSFGCVHSTTGSGEEPDCSVAMKSAFKASFIELQDTLKKFFTTEMSEEELLSP